MNMKCSKIFLAAMIVVVVASASCTRKTGLGCPQNFGKLDKAKTEQKNV